MRVCACVYVYTYIPVYMYMCICVCVCLCLCLYTNPVSDSGEGRRTRSRIHSDQSAVLKAAFAMNRYLSSATLMQVVQQTGLGKKKILLWFKNRRYLIRPGENNGAVSISEYTSNYMYLHVFIN